MPILETMLPHEISIIQDINRHEREFGRPLPNDSFYKGIALGIMRKYGVTSPSSTKISR